MDLLNIDQLAKHLYKNSCEYMGPFSEEYFRDLLISFGGCSRCRQLLCTCKLEDISDESSDTDSDTESDDT